MAEVGDETIDGLLGEVAVPIDDAAGVFALDDLEAELDVGRVPLPS